MRMWSNWDSAGGDANGEATSKTIWQFLKKLTINIPYDPAIPLLGKYPRKNENLYVCPHKDL